MNINNSSGIIDFMKAYMDYEIKSVEGMEFRNGDELFFIGLTRNNT